MAVSAVPGAGMGAAPNRPNRAAAQIAEARRMVRDATPAGAEDAVAAEVGRLQDDRGIPVLASLHAVHARLVSGWTPSSGPSGR